MGPTSPSIPASFAVTSDSRFADGFQFLRDRLGTNPTKVVDDGYTFLLRENPSSSYSSSSAANPTLTRTPNSVTYPPTAGGISPQRESPGTRITADGNDKPVEGGQRRDTVIKAEQQNPITKPATRPQRSLKDILDKLHSTKPKFRTLSSIGSSTYSELVKQDARSSQLVSTAVIEKQLNAMTTLLLPQHLSVRIPDLGPEVEPKRRGTNQVAEGSPVPSLPSKNSDSVGRISVHVPLQRKRQIVAMLSAGDLDQLVPPSAALGVDAVDRGEGHRNGHGYSSDEAPGQMRSPKRHRREPARTRTTRPSKPQVSAKAQGTRNDAASNGSMQQQQQQGQKGRGVPAMRDAPPELVGRCEAESKKYNKLGRDHKHRGDKAREAHNELRAIAHYLEAVGCFVQSLWYSDVYLAPQVLLDRWRTVVDFVDFVYNECDKLRESAMAGIAAMIRATANYVIGRVYLEQARRISSGIAGKNENGGDENEEEEAVVEEGRKANNSASSKLARRSRAAAECSQKSAENADQAERWFIVSEARLSVAHLMQQFENTWRRCVLQLTGNSSSNNSSSSSSNSLQDHVLATRGEGESDVQRRYEARNAPEDYPNHPHSAASMHSTLSTRPLAYPLSPMSNMLDVVAFCQSILYEWMSHKGIRDLI